jgi:4-amino-4-deoxy-L-arabinose transferase-like glycosyltransferase
MKLSVTVYVDLGLLFFFTASLFSILIWLEDPKRIRWIIISGICSGLALSTKYNAMLSVTLITLLFGYFFLKTRNNKIIEQLNTIKYMAIFTFCALLVYSPWLIRNYSLTGNPIYPLHQSFFSQISKNDAINDETNEKKLDPLTMRKVVYNESLIYSLAVPIRIFYEGQDDNPQYFDGKINPLLLLFSFLLVVLKNKRWQNQFLATFVILTLLYTVLAVDMRIRYVITIVPPMIILSVFGLFELTQWLKRRFPDSKTPHLIITPLILIYFVYNISYGINLYKNIDPMPFLTEKISRDDYISNKLSYYSLNKIANKVVHTHGKLLGIYTGNRRYYIDVPLSLESTLPIDLVKNISNASELAQEFSNRNITLILVRTR